MAEELQETIAIEATPQELYDVVADLESYPDWVDGCESAVVLESDDDGRPYRVEMVIDAQVKKAKYTLQYEHDYPNVISWVTEEGGDIAHMEGSYTFADGDEAETVVDYHLVLDLGFPVPGMIVRKLTRHIMKAALQGLEDQALQLQ